MSLIEGAGAFENMYNEEDERRGQIAKDKLKDTIDNNKRICDNIDKELKYLKSIGEIPEDIPKSIINYRLSLAQLNAKKIDIDNKISKLEAELCELYKLSKQYEEVIRMADNKVGVINEQGYVGAQLGFTPLNEADQKSLKDKEETEKKENEKE
jgi:hypothetical protein